jgi:hypothetical protein
MENCCKETLIFATDLGDGETTFTCQLEKGHEGSHKESGKVYRKSYELTWGDPE